METLGRVKAGVQRVPVLGPVLTRTARTTRMLAFPGSQTYWERHYARGGGSGEGSLGRLGQAKADLLNHFVAANGVESVIEFGCGDGQQLALAKYPRYLGIDVSASVLRRTSAAFAADPTKSFLRYDPECFTDPGGWLTADLALSLDVIYHLVEDDAYHLHLRHVFGAGGRFVLLFTSDADRLRVMERQAPHVRHRPVVRDIAEHFPEWELTERIPSAYPYEGAGTDTSFAETFVYQRTGLQPRPGGVAA